MADSEHGGDAPALSALAASRWLFETSSHVLAGFENFSKGHSWPGSSRRDRFPSENRIRMGGHGPAQLARRVFVAPGGCRRAPARSATCPTCTLPDRTYSCVDAFGAHSCGNYMGCVENRSNSEKSKPCRRSISRSRKRFLRFSPLLIFFQVRP